MKLLQRLSIGFLLAANTLPAVAQEAPVPAVEPDNGFVRGADPEWSRVHQDAPGSDEEHRAYHRDGAAALLRWLDANADRKGTPAYDHDYRRYRQERNLAHRLWHLGVDAAEVTKPVTRPVRRTPVDPSRIVIPHKTAGRTYEGHRPSRRAIVDEQESWNAENADARK